MIVLATCAASSWSGNAIELKMIPGSGIISSRKPSGNSNDPQNRQAHDVKEAAGNHETSDTR